MKRMFLKIVLLPLLFILNTQGLFASNIIEMDIHPSGKETNFAGFECNIINNSSQTVFIKHFLSMRLCHTIIVREDGIVVKDRSYSQNPKHFDYYSHKTSPIVPGNSQSFFTSVGKECDFSFQLPGVFYVVHFIPKPSRQKGVLFSPIIKFSLSREQRVESYSKIGISEIPFVVKGAFLSEILSRLKDEKAHIIRSEIPFE